MRRIVLTSFQSPGDLVMLTAAIRDLHLAYPGQFETDVRTPCPQLWENNPFITPLQADWENVETIQCEYPLIHRSNQEPWHFLHGFVDFLNQRLGLSIKPTAFKGDIHVSDTEKSWISQVQEITDDPVPFWIINAGGKLDYTIKWWDPARYQAVVDHFRNKILFVQVGESGHNHPALDGVLDLRGKTDLRQLIRLVYHAQGVLGPVSLLMHLAAAVEVKAGMPKNRPCVVVAGGREPPHWEAYPHHQFIHTVGALRCCDDGGCWKSRTLPLGDGDEKDRPENLCVDVVGTLPRCMDMITASEVIRHIQLYRDGGVAPTVTLAHRASLRLAESRARLRGQCAQHRRSRTTGPDGAAKWPGMERIVPDPEPSVGLVIGTFGSIPYVHIALESWRRNCPVIPVLVSDDCSPQRGQLERLCGEYGADFISNSERKRWTVGDMSAIVQGLEWAREQHLTLLVKMSRRFIPLQNWVPELQRLAYNTQYATFSNICKHSNFGFRTECLGLHVGVWCECGPLENLRDRVERNEPAFVEAHIHNLARDVHALNCRANRAYELEHPRPSEANAYGVWGLMSDRRTTRRSDVLWHDADGPVDYARVAQLLGLRYPSEDFEDPNQGCGRGAE